VLYEVGYKHEKPAAPILISFVYCGRIQDSGQTYYLLVEFFRWGTKTQRGFPIEAKDGLKVRTLEQLMEGRETWAEVCTWTRKNAKAWRKEMKK
jgi:hypothetical protein